jgi:hypothetical protein
MAGPRVSVQRTKILHRRGAHGVEMEITDQLEQVRFFLAQDGLVAILKEIPVAVVPAVERPRVSGQEAAHDRRQGDAASAEQ